MITIHSMGRWPQTFNIIVPCGTRYESVSHLLIQQIHHSLLKKYIYIYFWFSKFPLNFFKKSSPEDIFFIAFRERGRERTLMCKRSNNWLPPKCTWTGDWTCNLRMCPDQESNLQPFGYETMLQLTEPHWPGIFFFLSSSKNMLIYFRDWGREGEREGEKHQ